MARVRTLRQAATWIERVGLALLLPKADVALPSLWEQINGSPARDWAVRDDDGTFVRWREEMGILWRTKDELPAQRLACVGRHAARAVACVAPTLLPALVAAVGEAELDEDEQRIVGALADGGPLSAARLRRALGLEKRAVERAVGALERKLVVTHAGLVEEGTGWDAVAYDLVSRIWPMSSAPSREEARRTLAATVLASAGELTAADLRGIFGWAARDAGAVLDGVAEGRDAGGFRIWTGS